MNKNVNAIAKCPYYVDAEKNRVQCESCVKGARLYLLFLKTQTLAEHRRRYCDSYTWYLCPYARQRTRDWEERERGADQINGKI